MKNYIILLIILAGIMNPLIGQSLFTFDQENNNLIYLKGGIQPNMSIRLGYARNLPLFNSNLTIYGEYHGALFRAYEENAEIRVGGILPITGKRKFKLVNEILATVGQLKTTHFNSARFTVGNEIDYGYYSDKWRINLSLQYQWIYLSKISPTDFYRDTFYENAQENWYTGNGGFFLMGIETSWLIAERFDLGFWIKYPTSQQGNSLQGSPGHAALEFGWRF